VFGEFLVVADSDCDVHGVRRSVDEEWSVFYLIWLTLVGCLIVAAPVFGVLPLVAGLAIVMRTRHGR
jgi:hypothetical protein